MARYGLGRTLLRSGPLRLGWSLRGPYAAARVGGAWIFTGLGRGHRTARHHARRAAVYVIRVVPVPRRRFRVYRADGAAVLLAVTVWAFVVWQVTR